VTREPTVHEHYSIGDSGRTLDAVAAEYAFSEGAPDFVFVDHDKDAYVADPASILGRGWFHPGPIVVADNVKLPGAPEYGKYMQEHPRPQLVHDRGQGARRVSNLVPRPGAGGRVAQPGVRHTDDGLLGALAFSTPPLR
jgi:predicted O-methyltransferase YrrM